MRVHFVRHASFDAVGERLAGRTAVSLNETGRTQAAALAEVLAEEPLAAVYTSPQPRALETAEPIARVHGLAPISCAAFDEIDFGDWTGRTVSELSDEADWTSFNALRSLTRVPGGELMLETQLRAVGGLLQLQQRHPDDNIAVVSHADVIRAVLGHLLGLPMDNLLRLEIAPASISTVQLHGAWPQVLRISDAPGRTR